MPTEQPVIQVGAEQPEPARRSAADDASLDDVIPPSPGGGGPSFGPPLLLGVNDFTNPRYLLAIVASTAYNPKS